MCYRTRKTLVNPIIDWTDAEVWEFIKDIVKAPHCSLYDKGFDRIGCIGCPLAGRNKRLKELERYPTYKRAYLRAFDKMIKARKDRGLATEWKTAEDVFKWWLSR